MSNMGYQAEGVLKKVIARSRKATWQSPTYFISSLGDCVATLAMTEIKVF
jgi:hypothetical protein